MASSVPVLPDTLPMTMRTPKARRSRPSSRQGSTPQTSAGTAAARPQRKIFNCIVDDTALVAGVKRSTRNGIQQWVKHGQIRLFVPLHALEELSRQKNQKNRHGEDVRETLQWLDEATSKYPHVVTLQEADHTFERWADVERFAVPRTLFSEYDHDEPETDDEELPAETASKLVISESHERSSDVSDLTAPPSPASPRSPRSSASPISPPTSPAKGGAARAKPTLAPSPIGRGAGRASGGVPVALRALFNYILWRIHQELDPAAALESFIFLCNDAAKTAHARGFDVKTKRLEQLREAIGREDREYRNRQALLHREHGLSSTGVGGAPASPPLAPITPRDAVDGGDDDLNDEDDFDCPHPSPPKAPAAMLHLEKSPVMDPHAFGRGAVGPTGAIDPALTSPRSPRQHHPAPTSARGSPRGSHAQPHRGSSGGNGRGGAAGSGRGSVRAHARGGRGGRAGAGGAAASTDRTAAATAASAVGQIDPDSFSRPNPRGNVSAARGRGGGGRKLWVPT